MKYDCIVLGVGGIGSGALLAAAKRGWKVLGLEQFGAVHDKGSSHGHTRIIRTAYFEHPNYVPLCQRAWLEWEQLQASCQNQLIQKTGLLQVGAPDLEVITGVLESAKLHDLSVTEMSAAEVMKRFPAIKVNDQHVGVFEEQAGFLRVENCVAELLKRAMEAGAEMKADFSVGGWSIESDGTIVVHGESENYRAERLIVTAGAWFKQLFPDLPIDLQIIRKQQQWFQIDRTDVKYQNGFPCFLFEDESGCFYGMPEIDYLAMKIAEHSGGQATESADKLDRSENANDRSRAEKFLNDSFVFTKSRLVHSSVCMYSMSSDGHFVVDQHPDHDQIAFACGMSGHGFKFAPILGQRLVEILDGKDDSNFDFLRIGDRQLASALS